MTPISASKPVVAAFDFDGTLTYRDTLFPFLLYLSGPFCFSIRITRLLPILAAYAVGFVRNDIAKISVLRAFLNQMEMHDLQQRALRFAEDKLPSLLRSEAMQRFAWHKQQGHRCIVVSASLELYLSPWASKAGFDDVIGSRLDVLDNNHTNGNLNGANCFGPEKIQRLHALLGSREGYTLYAYGDSRGDKELLSAADYPYYQSFTTQGLYK